MKSDQFIERLERENAVSQRLVAKLREKLADSGGRLPARSLAEFLVQKQHLTAAQAAVLLDDQAAGDDFDEAEASAISSASQLRSSELLPDDDAAAEDSSVLPMERRPDEEEPPPPEIPDAERQRAGTRGRTGSASRRARPARRRKNEWDSPLLLLGGGGLVLLLICGVTVYFLLFRDTGDELLAAARSAMGSGSYSQAISQYERFLEDFAGHPEQSNARVELAMAKLRRATEGRSDYRSALEVAEAAINDVQNEPSFPEAHDELATLLPRIARGLAEQAEADPDPATATPLAEHAYRALELSANTKYVPKTLRDEGELRAIRDTLGRVERRRESYDDLQNAIAQMKQAIEAGDTRTAYESHRALLKKHPQLSEDSSLLEVVAQTSAAEKDGIHFVGEEQAASVEERPSAVRIAVTLGHHRGGAAAQASGIVCVHAQGAVYGLDAKTGELRWRRYVGLDEVPVLVRTDDGLLVCDARHHDLLNIAVADGRLLWRQPIGEPFVQPLLVRNRIFVATESGRLHVVDMQSGNREGYLQFAQQLPTPPGLHSDGRTLYLIGDHSSLYCISLDQMKCIGVRYLGHSSGSIRVSPMVISGKLAVFENRGVASSRLRLFALDSSGVAGEMLHEDRLSGLVNQPPLTVGRRLIVLTDLGEMNVYEIGPQADGSAITMLAARPATHSTSRVQYTLLADSYIWVADDRLAKYAVQATDNRLPAISIEQNYTGANFVHPLQEAGQALVHVRRPPDRLGTTVAAMDMATGKPLWEIDLAVPPAGPPVLDAANANLTTASANGYVFVLDRGAIARRLATQPLAARGQPPRLPQLTSSLALDSGRGVFSTIHDSPWLLTYDPSRGTQPARWLELPGAAAAPPEPLGAGFIVPLSIGQVFYVEPSSAEPLQAVFQPPTSPGDATPWLPVGVIDGEPNRCVLVDRRGKVYLVRLEQGNTSMLSVENEAEISIPLTSGVAVAGSNVFIGAKDGKLVRLERSSLKAGEPIALSGRPVWGPYRAADCVLVATDAQQLHCLDAGGATRWQVPLSHGDLVGRPLASGDAVLVAFENGHLQRLHLSSGEELRSTDVGQPLAAGPIRLQTRLVVAGYDGSLLVVDEE